MESLHFLPLHSPTTLKHPCCLCVIILPLKYTHQFLPSCSFTLLVDRIKKKSSLPNFPGLGRDWLQTAELLAKRYSGETALLTLENAYTLSV